AFAAGVDFFDTANVYPVGGGLDLVGRTEEIVGKWLKGKREQIVLATKCWGAMGRGTNEHGLSRKHILTAIEGSLGGCRRITSISIRPMPRTSRRRSMRRSGPSTTWSGRARSVTSA